jgi:hypothetical protein
MTQLPSLGGGSVAGNRPSQLPANRPGAQPGQRPGGGNAGNFLGIAGGAAAGGALGGAIANRPSTLPANRPGAGQLPAQRPEQRPNWGERSQGRNEQWNQRVSNRNDAWTQRDGNRQQARNDFQQNRDQRWDNLNTAREDRQNWRNQNRGDWQQRRQDLWNYRGDRANEIWDNARDFYDDAFDDRWWGRCGWGFGWGGYYPVNPWWWWAPPAWESVETYVEEIPPEPLYTDYGMNVIYEGETVYVDNQPVPADQYTQPMIDLAVNAEPQPPPMPPAEGQQAEWMPLGVFALAQEEKGDPILLFQLSVNRAGQITGAYKSTIADDQRPVVGQVQQATQRVAWRIGDNKQTIFISTLANLTQEVSPVAIHFGSGATQTWLLVRMPAPAPAGQPEKLPEPPKTPPPLKTAKAN